MSLESNGHRDDTFDILTKATELKLLQDTEHGLRYHKMVQTGKLDFCDYGVGFLNFEIYASPCSRNPAAYPIKSDEWYVRIWIATIDDGDMGARSKPMHKAKARGIVHAISEDVMRGLVSFPDRGELNFKLRPFGLFIDHE